LFWEVITALYATREIITSAHVPSTLNGLFCENFHVLFEMPRRIEEEEDERRYLLENGGKRMDDSRLQLESTNLGYFERRRRLKKLKQVGF
jgi:hypothetical protein